MKHNQKHNIFGWLMASTLLLTTACTSVADFDVAQVNKNEPKIVTITVLPQSQSVAMRDASEESTTPKVHVSKGSKVDILYYTVYEVDDDGKVKATENQDLIKGSLVGGILDEDLGQGQSVIPAKKESYPIKIRLTVASETKYKVAFWAQNSTTNAFNVKDLTNVQVNYENATNNDELRDAFCAVTGIIDGSETENRVTLRRPFSQINVGTTGADYKHILHGTWVYPNKKITKSKIRLTGVSKTIDVVNDVIGAADTNPVTFEWHPLAAYINNDYEIPSDEDLLKCEGEEFLRVDLDSNGIINRYKTSYPTLSRTGRYLTETFKYLSMCYALVPATHKSDAVEGSIDPYESSTLDKVEVFFGEKDVTDGDNAQKMTLTNVPVHRNWRTNIIGGLYYIDDPENPYNPDDPDEPYDPGYPDDDDPDDPKDNPDPDNPKDYPDNPDNPDPDNPDPDNPDPDNPDPDNPDPDTPGPDDDIPTGDDPTSVFKFTNIQIQLDPWYDDEYNGNDQWTDYPAPSDNPENEEENEEEQGK